MHPITVIFTTFNEAHNIAAAIESVCWADELIVVDSFSSDQTVEIAKRMGAVVFERKYSGPGDQKNWAIPKAKNEWVLLMDADERVTTQLRKEIENTVSFNTSYDAYWIGFQHYFMNRLVRHSGWGNDKTIRLIRRDKCRYNNSRVHEEIITKDIDVGILKNRFEHYTYKDIDHFIDKIQRYSSWSAEDYEPKTGHITWYHLVLKPVFRFLKHYVWKLGFLDGKVGFIISAIMAWGVMMRYVKIMEIRERAVGRGR